MLEVCLQHLVGRVQFRGQVFLVSGQPQFRVGLVIGKGLLFFSVLRWAKRNSSVTPSPKAVQHGSQVLADVIRVLEEVSPDAVLSRCQVGFFVGSDRFRGGELVDVGTMLPR